MKQVVLALLMAFATAPKLALLPPAKCAEAIDRPRCEAARPKPWTDSERDVMRPAIERLESNPSSRAVMQRAIENGYAGLQRYASDSQPDATGTAVAKFGPGFVLYRAKTIGITDAFFQMADLRDPRSGYRVADLVLLHELAHAFDDRMLSTDPVFTSVTGWKLEGGRWQYTNRVSISEYNGVYAQTVTSYARGDHADAWARDRAFATSLPFPLPRIQALATPGETFADVLAHLILDPDARKYLDPRVVQWFDKHVFSGLRASGGISDAHRLTASATPRSEMSPCR